MSLVLAKVKTIKHLGAGPMETLNPFLFCVYHKDRYPAGDDQMHLPNKIGNGMDFNPLSDYRMYHGKHVPGFPQHPHRGFETLTATLEGIIDHTDSLGNAGRYGNGDLQWMTAGKGIVHGENFPLLNQSGGNPLKLFQIWLNLPKKNKLVDPDFVMHWAEEIQHVENDEEGFKVTVFAGEFQGKRGLKPTKHSWATDPENDVAVFYIRLKPNGKVTIPRSKYGNEVNRAFYIVEGKGAKICGEKVTRKSQQFGTFVSVTADGDALLDNDSDGNVEVLMLQGRPINEPVVQQGPFVMNSQKEIRETYLEYQRTGFGGWPWEADAVLFDRADKRFARINGENIYPPAK